mmetsp:Transcript_10968/g.22462  ORF Transcript_10968/g.22462 Transcript_10968/m.22462 type:complete len:353 (+) Transcript_10968:124-1182(+)
MRMVKLCLACFSVLLLNRATGFMTLPVATLPDLTVGSRDMAGDAVTSATTLLTALPPIFAPTVAKAIELGAFPAIGMNIVTVLGLNVPTPPKLVGALQHFSAGILLTTIAKELLPEMVKAQGFVENAASGIGFFAGVGVLILLGILLPDDEEEVEKELAAEIPHTSNLRNRKLSLKSRAFAKPHIEDAPPLTSPTKMEAVVSALPTALLAAVAIDSALDGLLIGISTAVDPGTGPLLSASLTVESSFLGLTIAAALRNRPAPLTWLILAASLAPAGILTGAISGGNLAPMLSQNNALLTGCLGFGTSTTLFMVAEELLLQAHEDGSEHVWWVDLQLYTGFFASVMIEKFFGM